MIFQKNWKRLKRVMALILAVTMFVSGWGNYDLLVSAEEELGTTEEEIVLVPRQLTEDMLEVKVVPGIAHAEPQLVEVTVKDEDMIYYLFLIHDVNGDGFWSKFQYEETVSSIEYDMKDIYIIGIEETIKKEIIDLGYEVNKIEIKLDYNCENINEVKIEILKNENRDSIEITNILKMLNEKYLVKENNVFIIFK